MGQQREDRALDACELSSATKQARVPQPMLHECHSRCCTSATADAQNKCHDASATTHARVPQPVQQATSATANVEYALRSLLQCREGMRHFVCGDSCFTSLSES